MKLIKLGVLGVILFPWTARVYDRDAVNQKSDDENIQPIAASSDPNVNNKEVQKRTQTFYQVLIDQRDVPFIRAQTEAVTFLANNQENSRSLYAIPGLDYVSKYLGFIHFKFIYLLGTLNFLSF